MHFTYVRLTHILVNQITHLISLSKDPIVTEEQLENEQANASFALLIMLSVLLLSFLGAYVIRQKRFLMLF
jgi:hypothetical protein